MATISEVCPRLLIDAQYASKRTRPLIVTGPKGIAQRFQTAAEALYPNITNCPCAFGFEFVEYEEQVPLELNGVTITPFEVKHPSGAPPYALRLRVGRQGAFFHRRHRLDGEPVPCRARRGSAHQRMLSSTM